MTDLTHVIDVPLKTSPYQVFVGQGLLDELGTIAAKLGSYKKAVIISDTNVAPLYADSAAASLAEANIQPFLALFEAGEKNKRLTTIEDLLEGIAEAELDRGDLIVALGGGVTGDMAGLCAALYLRGIDYIQVPTSLLAMVDSSIGGKTAVDLAAGKNLCGAFKQPKAVIADIDCLDTIEPELLYDSVGEIIKHAVLADPELFAEVSTNDICAADFDRERLISIIAKNIEIKRDVVLQDEFEKDLRKTLNLGHTIGHAIEAANEFSLGHGSSVAAGLCLVSRLGEKLGITEPGCVQTIEEACAFYKLPTTTDFSADVLFDYLVHDKKRGSTDITLVIPKDVGEVILYKMPLESLKSQLDDLLT